jgi:hypothetical protein
LELRHGSKLRLVLQNNLGQGRDVVQGLTLSTDRVLHGLVDSIDVLVAGEAVDAGLLEVLCLSVDLQLAGDTLEHVQLPCGHVLAHHHGFDLSNITQFYMYVIKTSTLKKFYE